MTSEQESAGSMFLVRSPSRPELLKPGAEVLLDLGHEALAGTVLSRSSETFQFRPWGRPELTLSTARVSVAQLPEHSLADRAAAIERQRAGYSAAPPACESTPARHPQRVAMRIDPSLVKRG